MDYVAGLSLTFEQANLDFARYFANGFAAIGDDASARLLERIYRDEIGHVAYGLKWFRRWKEPGEMDWEAFCRRLKFPLSPQRAKGLILNIEGRRAAGLAPEFIDALNVYSQSKGRTPTVFVFNPFAEGYIARGKSFMPVKHQALLASDLANLPQFLCRQDDVVLVERRPSVQFLSSLKQAGFALPEFVEMASMQSALSERKLGGLRPWAWGPDSVELFAPLFSQVRSEPLKPDDCFNERVAQLYSKGWSAGFLRKVLSQAGSKPWLCTHEETGTVAESLAEAMDAIEAIRRRGHHKIAVKQALGLAGQNAIRLWEPALLENQRRWLECALENGQKVVVEPWLERQMDFSVQLEMTGEKLRLLGFTGLVNDKKGQFQGNWAGPGYGRRMPTISSMFGGTLAFPREFQEFYTVVFSLLERELSAAGFRGPISIDAFVYQNADGRSRLKPIVEINPRYTMGRLTLELMRRTTPGSHGLFRLVNRKQAQRDGFEDFAAYALALAKRYPLRLQGQPVARIHEGAVCLNDPSEAQACMAVFEVSRSPFAAVGVSQVGCQ
jgi:hypothetical protein